MERIIARERTEKGRRHRRRRVLPASTLISSVLAVGLLVAGCGGGSAGSARVATTPTTTAAGLSAPDRAFAGDMGNAATRLLALGSDARACGGDARCIVVALLSLGNAAQRQYEHLAPRVAKIDSDCLRGGAETYILALASYSLARDIVKQGRVSQAIATSISADKMVQQGVEDMRPCMK